MANFIVTKDNTPTKIKAEVKTAILESLISSLKSIYGEENVFWCRTGAEGSKKNELAVIVDHAEVDGEEVAICAMFSGTVKDFVDRTCRTKTFEAFDYVAAREAYNEYMKNKNSK